MKSQSLFLGGGTENGRTIFFLDCFFKLKFFYKNIVLKITFFGLKMNFCNKNVFFLRKLYYIYLRERIRGELWFVCNGCKRYLAFKRNKQHNKEPWIRFWCIWSLFKSLSFQLVKYCRPHLRATSRIKSWDHMLWRMKRNQSFDWFLFVFLSPLSRLKKRPTFQSIFFIPWMGWKKGRFFRSILFIPFVAVEKKANLAVDFFYTLCRGWKKANLAVDFFIPPSGFEPLLREWKSRVLGH